MVLLRDCYNGYKIAHSLYQVKLMCGLNFFGSGSALVNAHATKEIPYSVVTDNCKPLLDIYSLNNTYKNAYRVNRGTVEIYVTNRGNVN